MVRRILVCDDDQRLARLVGGFLGQRGYEVDIVADGDQALEALERLDPNVLITDVQMPGLDGFELLRRVRSTNPACAVIMMTGYGSVEAAGRAKQLGALHYLQKPFPPEDLLNILDRLKKGAQPFAARARFPEMVGESAGMREVFAKILQVANSDLSVLVTGETGTGKELVCTAIHRLSFRSQQPFISVNCATLEHDLFESELFGHSAGAFTGAMRAKEGLLSAASPGTLFLDEIGEMSKRSQAKLLRSIETGELRRLGETKSVKVDVRIVAATNRRLRWLASEGAFRSDLFFRLAAFTIDLPPLRDRKTDIPLLARALLRRGHASASGFGVELSDDAVGALCEYGWPGNVRELQNTVRSAAVRCVNDDSERIEVRHLMLSQFEDFQAGMQGPKVATQDSASELDFKALRLGDAGSYRGLREEIVRNFDRRYFTQLLTETGGNVSKAARLAGLDRKRLREKLGTVGLAADDFRS